METVAPADEVVIRYPRGFRARRGLNWVVLGGMYASFYMLRYNFRWAAPGMEKEFGFNHASIASILSAWAIAYGTGQLINGLFCDRIGGRASMIIGGIGTIAVNLVFGFASFVGTLSTFALIWLINGYFQSFGAPGMVAKRPATNGFTRPSSCEPEPEKISVPAAAPPEGSPRDRRSFFCGESPWKKASRLL